MSDLSLLDQSFALPSAAYLPPPFDEAAALPEVSTDVQPDEVNFRHLRTPGEISRVLHLRDEIRLPAAARADAAFATREKKETRWAWSARSCASVNT